MNNKMILSVRRLTPTTKLPSYGTPGSAALDVYPDEEGFSIPPGTMLKIKTGLSVEFLSDYAMLLLPRSGNAAKYSVTLQNAPGLIDSDYRGELILLVRNEGTENFPISRDKALAQILMVPIPRINVVEVETLSGTVRGSGGFGSTDK